MKNLEVGVLVVGVSEEARGGNPCIDGGSGADLENSGNSPVAAGGRGCAGCRRQWVCRLGSGKLRGSCFPASIFSVREWARPSAGCDQGNVEVKDLKKGKTETVIENKTEFQPGYCWSPEERADGVFPVLGGRRGEPALTRLPGRHAWVSTTLMQETKQGAVVRSRCPLGIYRQASTAR